MKKPICIRKYYILTEHSPKHKIYFCLFSYILFYFQTFLLCPCIILEMCIYKWFWITFKCNEMVGLVNVIYLLALKMLFQLPLAKESDLHVENPHFLTWCSLFLNGEYFSSHKYVLTLLRIICRLWFSVIPSLMANMSSTPCSNNADFLNLCGQYWLNL